MKPNDGCALEKLVDGRWVPLAIRYQQLSAIEVRSLDQGETIIKDGAQIRRYDWLHRQDLVTLFSK